MFSEKTIICDFQAPIFKGDFSEASIRSFEKAINGVLGKYFIGVLMIDTARRTFSRVLFAPLDEDERPEIKATAELGLQRYAWEKNYQALLNGRLGFSEGAHFGGSLLPAIIKNNSLIVLAARENGEISLVNVGGGGDIWRHLRDGEISVEIDDEPFIVNLSELNIDPALVSQTLKARKDFRDERVRLFDTMLVEVANEPEYVKLEKLIKEGVAMYGEIGSVGRLLNITNQAGYSERAYRKILRLIDQKAAIIIQDKGEELPIFKNLTAMIDRLGQMYEQAQAVVGELKSPEWVYRF